VAGKIRRVEVFQDLVTGGLKRILIFVTGDFPGFGEVIKKLYPFSDHQLCFLHMQRNLGRDLPKKVYQEIKPHLFLSKGTGSKEEGLKYFFEFVCSVIENKSDKLYAQRLRERANNYLAFLSYSGLCKEAHIH
jgi:putative transposase